MRAFIPGAVLLSAADLVPAASTAMTTATYSSSTELTTITFEPATTTGTPAVCIAPQFPPFTCEQCPQEDIEQNVELAIPQDYGYSSQRVELACRRDEDHEIGVGLVKCFKSIEDCCDSEWPIIEGYGYNYCINRSGAHGDTTTSAPYITTDTATTTPYTPDGAEVSYTTGMDSEPSSCIAPLIKEYYSTCRPCPQEYQIQVADLCLWSTMGDHSYGECFKSVEECCEVFRFDGAEVIDKCIDQSGPPAVCITLQVPPFTCEQCPESDIYFNAGWDYTWMCSQPVGFSFARDCYSSIENCCRDRHILDPGYGYDYCISKYNTSEIISTTIAPWAADSVETHYIHEDVCITPLFHTLGTCEPCPEAYMKSEWCEWNSGYSYGECFKSVEECCEVFQWSEPGMVDRCVTESGRLPGVCVAPQFPPVTCARCPDEDVSVSFGTHSRSCSLDHSQSSSCHMSIEACCSDSDVVYRGYGYDYCVNKSSTLEDCSTSTPYITISGPDHTETPNTKTTEVTFSSCIAPRFPLPGTCELCPEGDVLYGNACRREVSYSDTQWMSPQFVECYESVKECCKVFEFFGIAMESYCVNESGQTTTTSTPGVTTSIPDVTTTVAYVTISTFDMLTNYHHSPLWDSTTTATETTTTESTSTQTPLPACVSPQFPPFTCEQCPEADIDYGRISCDKFGCTWATCRRHQDPHWTREMKCHRSVQDCCNDDLVLNWGYGYDYCVNKSRASGDTSTSTTTIATGTPSSTETWHPTQTDLETGLCIAPQFPAPGTCEPCPQATYGNVCFWYFEHPGRYGECYESVEECCKVFESSGTGMVDYCTNMSGQAAKTNAPNVTSTVNVATSISTDGPPTFSLQA